MTTPVVTQLSVASGASDIDVQSTEARARFRFGSAAESHWHCLNVRDIPNTYTMRVAATNGSADWTDKRLWEIRGRFLGGDELRISPANSAQGFCTEEFAYAGGEGAILEWRGVPVPGSDHTLWVRIACRVPTGSPDIEWFGWCGPERGGDFRIEQFNYPSLQIANDSSDRAGDALNKGSQRNRVLWPINNTTQGVQMHNNSVAWWNAFSGVEQRIGVPGQQGQLPFAAHIDCNDQDALAYLGFLMVWTKRDKPWFMEMVANGGLAESHRTWRLQMSHCPIKGDDHGVRDERGMSPWRPTRNSFAPRYPTVTTPLKAKTADWWWDVCEHYRDWYEAALNPTPTRDIARREFQNRPSAMYACITQNYQDSQWLQEVKAEFADWLVEMQSDADASLELVVAQFQIYQLNTNGNVQGPTTPLMLMDGYEELVQWFHDQGVRVAPYTSPNILFEQEGIEPSTYKCRHDIDGNRLDATEVGRPGSVVEGVVQWVRALSPMWRDGLQKLRNVILPFFRRVPHSAIYLDSYSGDHYPFFWSTNTADDRPFEEGGNYVQVDRRAEVMDECRRWIEENDPLGQGKAVLMSEQAEEPVSHRLDFCQDGYTYRGLHFILAEAAFDPFQEHPLHDYPEATRQNMLPLWQAVHGEWGSNNHLTHNTSLVHLGKITELYDGVSEGTTNGGLTAIMYQRLYALLPMIAFLQGNSAMVFSGSWSQRAYMKRDGAWHPEDTDGVGPAMMAYYSRLLAYRGDNFGGPFVLRGRMERPAVTDLQSSEMNLANNPAENCRFMLDWALPLAESRSDYPNLFLYHTSDDPNLRFGNASWSMPRILHTCWAESRTATRIALFFGNWHTSSSGYECQIDTAHYPQLSAGATFKVDEHLKNGAVNSLATGLAAGVITFSTDGASGADVIFGNVASRTVKMLVVTVE